MVKRSQPLLVVALLLCSLNWACVRMVAEMRTTVAQGAIPKEFAANAGTLLVVRGEDKQYNHFLYQNFLQYAGPYEVIPESGLSDAAYTDLTKYRYAFHSAREKRKYNDANGKPKEYSTLRLFILDRSTQQRYPAKVTSPFYSKVMKAYIANLNQVLSVGK